MSNYLDITKSSSSHDRFGGQDVDNQDEEFTSSDVHTSASYRTPKSFHADDGKSSSVMRKGILTESVCNTQLDSLIKLKESTRKLLLLLEDISLKTHSKHIRLDGTPRLLNLVKPIPISSTLPSVTDLLNANALKQLENKTSALEAIYIEDEDDDCSIYKRLTRKCNCLNKPEYNDFTMLFNEETKFFTNSIGEIIKNMRILKKFLYMNGDYTKHALQFLNEAFTQSTYTEKVEIIQGIAYADICNLFEEYSIAIIHISWPCKYENLGDAVTQELTAQFLYKLAQLEEGRRYLNLSTKMANDLKKIMRKRAAKLEYETLETINMVLNILQPPLYQNVTATYYSKPVDEDYLGSRTINILGQNRKHMTLDEVFTHLEILNNYSTREKGKIELTTYLPVLMTLFRNMLVEYNNSAMNIVITNILNNIVSKNMVKEKDLDMPKTMVIADTATETITMKNEYNQIPPKKSSKKKNKSKIGLGLSPNKLRVASKRKVTDWEPTTFLNQSEPKRAHNNHYLRSSIIVVPVEKD